MPIRNEEDRLDSRSKETRSIWRPTNDKANERVPADARGGGTPHEHTAHNALFTEVTQSTDDTEF